MATPSYFSQIGQKIGNKNGAREAVDPKNPFAVAKAQTQSNIETAKAQQALGMTPQETPWGTVSYTADPNSPSGYRASTTLSPDQQFQLDVMSDLRAEGLGNVERALGSPFDLSAGRATELSDMQRTFLDPQWAEREQQLQANLLNRGIRPGSEQWGIATRELEDARSRAYNSMFLDAYGQANQAALMERQQPFSEMSTLFGLPQPGAPQWAPVPTPGVSPSDVIGSVGQANALKQQQQAMKTQSNNSMMGGMFGLGSSALMAAALLSDRRLKTDITRLADDPRGWGLYAFRYIWDAATAPLRFGYMAQEVAKVRPDAVLEGPNGFLMVDYGALA